MKVQVIIFVSLVVLLMAQEKKIVDQASCKENYTYLKCRPGCQNVCGRAYIWCGDKVCSEPNCYCTGEYSLTKEEGGKCVKTIDCPIKKVKRDSEPRFLSDDVIDTLKPMECPTNEVYMKCGPGCDSICGIAYGFCSTSCGKPGCYCTGEFASIKLGGACIKKTDCPKIPQ
uniref:TIL domain-containing protein n=1 Tax=Rhabditophanes sp. KR3021 TaxID=114890 RepID=A0AC35U2Z3_9BILA